MNAHDRAWRDGFLPCGACNRVGRVTVMRAERMEVIGGGYCVFAVPVSMECEPCEGTGWVARGRQP